jgi:hypothetical protein
MPRSSLCAVVTRPALVTTALACGACGHPDRAPVAAVAPVAPVAVKELVRPPGAHEVHPRPWMLRSTEIVDPDRAFAGTHVVIVQSTWHVDRYRPDVEPTCDSDCPRPLPQADATMLSIADVKTRVVYLATPLGYADEDGGTAVYAYAWRDLDGDHVPELVLDRTTMHGTFGYPEKVVFQVRHGRMDAVSPAGATCKDPRDRTPLSIAADARLPDVENAATAAFRDALGAPATLRCGLTNLFAGARDGLPAPEEGAPMFVDDKRGVIYVDRAHGRVIAVYLGSDGTISARDYDAPCIGDETSICIGGDARSITHVGGVFVSDDGEIEPFAYLEMTIEKDGKPRSYAVLFDFSVGKLAQEQLAGDGVRRTARFADDDKDGIPELIVSDGKQRVVWKYADRTWTKR